MKSNYNQQRTNDFLSLFKINNSETKQLINFDYEQERKVINFIQNKFNYVLFIITLYYAIKFKFDIYNHTTNIYLISFALNYLIYNLVKRSDSHLLCQITNSLIYFVTNY